MITRPTRWIDLKTLKPKFGLEVRLHGKWMGYAENGKPCIYDSEKERDAKRAEVRKIKTEDFTGKVVKARQLGFVAQPSV